MGVPIGLTFDAGDPERLGTAKNRLHMDVRVSAGVAGASEEERRARIEAAVAPLVAAGATMRNRSSDTDDFFIVMLDPEGNEFCLV